MENNDSKASKSNENLSPEIISKRDEKEEYFLKCSEITKKINKFYDDVKIISKENNLDKINEKLDSKKKILESVDNEISDLVDKKIEKDPTEKQTQLDGIKKELFDLENKSPESLSKDEKTKMEELYKSKKDCIFYLRSCNLDSLKDVKKKVEKQIMSIYKSIRIISKQKKVIYKQIDVLKNERTEFFKKFSDLKKELSENYKSNNGKKFSGTFNKNKRISQKELDEKAKNLQEKFLKGESLSTDDFFGN